MVPNLNTVALPRLQTAEQSSRESHTDTEGTAGMIRPHMACFAAAHHTVAEAKDHVRVSDSSDKILVEGSKLGRECLRDIGPPEWDIYSVFHSRITLSKSCCTKCMKQNRKQSVCFT